MRKVLLGDDTKRLVVDITYGAQHQHFLCWVRSTFVTLSFLGLRFLTEPFHYPFPDTGILVSFDRAKASTE